MERTIRLLKGLEKPVVLTKIRLLMVPDKGPENGKLPSYEMFK